MKINLIKTFDKLSDVEFVAWKKKSLKLGYITEGTSLKQMQRLWEMQLILNAGLDTNMSLDLANAILASKQLGSYILKNEIDPKSVESLVLLYQYNPSLAALYTKLLSDDGYMLNSEKLEKSKKSLDLYGRNDKPGFLMKVGNFLTGSYFSDLDKQKGLDSRFTSNATSRGVFDQTHLYNLYDKIHGELKKSRVSTNGNLEDRDIQNARYQYLSDANANTYKKIDDQINKYYSLEMDKKTPAIKQELKTMTPKELTKLLVSSNAVNLLGKKNYETPFDILAYGSQETLLSSVGDVIVNHPGSRYWRAYKDTGRFDKLGDDAKEEIMAKYIAYKLTFGENKANEYLENILQSYVANNRNIGQAFGDWSDASFHTASTLAAEGLVFLAGGLADALGYVTGLDYFKNTGSIMLTGKDAYGNEVGVNNVRNLKDSNFNLSEYLGSRANLEYLNKASQYNTFDIDKIRKAEANGGVSSDNLYIEDPLGGHKFKNDLLDASQMGIQLIEQAAVAALTGGLSIDEQALATMSKRYAATRLAAELAAANASIAGSYAINAANEAYDATMQEADELANKQAYAEWYKLSLTDEYKKESKKAIDDYFKKKPTKTDNGNILFNPIDNEENRTTLQNIYDLTQLQIIKNRILSERSDYTKQVALLGAINAFRTDAALEMLKYGWASAKFNYFRLSKNANKILESKLNLKKYGQLTLDKVGNFSRESVKPLGIKKLETTNPNIIAGYRAGENVIMGGGFTNFTDDLTTGLSTGLALSETNSALLREYNPEAFANTWYGDNAAAQLLNTLGGGYTGVKEMLYSGQPFHSFYIGTAGSVFGSLFRFSGRKDIKRQQLYDNAKYKQETGNDVTRGEKVKQWFYRNTNTLWSSYLQEKYGINNLDKVILDYNNNLSKRLDVLELIASIRLGIIQKQKAEDDLSFSDSQLATDDLYFKLINILHELELNPLASKDNTRINRMVEDMHAISEDRVSEETKEQLILAAFGRSELDKSKPLTEERKAELWENIKANANRFSLAESDYYEAIQELKKDDASLEEPQNWHLLNLHAELIVKSKRIQRDISSLAREIGISVDTNIQDNTLGELTHDTRTESIRVAKSTIERLREQKLRSEDKIKELSEKQERTEEDNKELSKALSAKMLADRALPRLEKELQLLEDENSSKLLTADSGLTNNVILLHTMLSNPKLYSERQQKEIEKYKKGIGEKGVLYIEEMAKMQDLLTEMLDALEALKAHPETFQNLILGLQAIRAEMGERAIYNVNSRIKFNYLKSLSSEIRDAVAATILNTDLFQLFIKENPDFSESLSKYKSINTFMNLLLTLTGKLVKNGRMDLKTLQTVLGSIQNLFLKDSLYLLDNGSQGVSDMLAFLAASTARGLQYSDVVSQLLTDFNRIASISAATTAYTEYSKKRLELKAAELAEELVKRMLELQLSASQLIETSDKPLEKDLPAAAQELIDKKQGLSDNQPLDSNNALPENELKNDNLNNDATDDKNDKLNKNEEHKLREYNNENLSQSTAGVLEGKEDNIGTMTSEELAEQIGVPCLPFVDNSAESSDKPVELLELQSEVHGSFFNINLSNSLRRGELIENNEGPIYKWLTENGINLLNIIDNELSNILTVNPEIKLMKVRKKGNDKDVAHNIFLVVEYTNDVAKYHLPENGGVITSNGKQYLIVGNMWYTAKLKETEAAATVFEIRDKILSNGVKWFTEHHAERFYVEPSMSTKVTTFNSGHIIDTINEETSQHTLSELIDNYNKLHTKEDLIDWSDIGFVIMTTKGYYPVGPISGRIHNPQRETPDKYGQVYVVAKAANGENIPIYINPILLSELRDSEIKSIIDTLLIPQLLSKDYDTRKLAVKYLSLLLCISATILGKTDKSILIGKPDIPTVSLCNAREVICTFNVETNTLTYKNGLTITNASISDFAKALYSLNPRINLNMINLTDTKWLKRYDEAGALTTPSYKLGTYGGKFYVALIDLNTGLPVEVQKLQQIQSYNESDYTQSNSDLTTLYVEGKKFVLRNNLWKKEDGTFATPEELELVAIAFDVQSNNATIFRRESFMNYYVKDIDSNNPIIITYNVLTRSYNILSNELAQPFIDLIRTTIEKNRANKEAKKSIEELKTEHKVKEAANANKVTIEISKKNYTREEVSNSDDKIFLFEDNLEDRKSGYLPNRGSAIIRGLPNSLGIVTKKSRGTSNKSYFTDSDFDEFKKYVDEIINKAKESGKVIVIPKNGIALNNNSLREHAPKLFDYLQELLNKLTNIKTSVTELKTTTDNNTEVSKNEPVNSFTLPIKLNTKYSIGEMLDSANLEILDKCDLIYDVIEKKIKKALSNDATKLFKEKWLNFDSTNLVSELNRVGINTENISDIDSWIKNLKDCE